jgi:hypothetical protein
MIIGIDPGKDTGIAIFENLKLTNLITTNTYGLIVFLQENKDRIEFAVVENSKGQKAMFKKGGFANNRIAAACGRNVGEIDGEVRVITEACEAMSIELKKITPRAKGKKLNSEIFKDLFPEYLKQTNQHTRDAAMCAYMYLY